MNLQAYMEQGVSAISEKVARYYLKNAAGIRFLASFIPALNKSAKVRAGYEKKGQHIPQFLICSITSRCNLHCRGCYARAGSICSDAEAKNQLTADEWRSVFNQAEKLGISFILLAGGEPLMRRDVLEAAACFPSIAFPVFTNGTMLDETYLSLFDEHRNLIPVLSIEGDGEATNARRGAGVAEKIDAVIKMLQAKNILYAASVTVTNKNLREVATKEYLSALRARNCGIIFYVEYVPVEKETKYLTLSESETSWLNQRVGELRDVQDDMCIFSFPGDEQFTEGCLAAGRGFFHINPNGGAEPCPFSPFSNLNVRECSLTDMLNSAFFEKVRYIEQTDTSHDGGCTLFHHADEVRALLQAETKTP